MTTQARPRLPARPRTPGRRSEIRALRRAGFIPASLYGHGEPRLITVAVADLARALKGHGPGTILDVEVDGQVTPAVIRELDRDPITGRILTLGLQRVDLREKVRLTLPIRFEGENELIDQGLVLQRQMEELEVQGLAGDLPEAITVDVRQARSGQTIRVGDLRLPPGVEPLRDPELPIATISLPAVAAAQEEAEAGLKESPAAHAAEAA